MAHRNLMLQEPVCRNLDDAKELSGEVHQMWEDDYVESFMR